MIQQANTHSVSVFQSADSNVAILVSPWVIRNCLKRLNISFSDLASLAGLGEYHTLEMLAGREPLHCRLRATYLKLRRFEAETLETYRQETAKSLSGEISRPRFLADHHMQKYAPEAWAKLPSARVSLAIQRCVANQLQVETGRRVSFVNFHKNSYEDWLGTLDVTHKNQNRVIAWLSRKN